MSRPDLAVVSFGLPGYETTFDRGFGEFLKRRTTSRCYHQGHAVVSEPAINRFDQVKPSIVEEKTICAEDHVVGPSLAWQVVVILLLDDACLIKNGSKKRRKKKKEEEE